MRAVEVLAHPLGENLHSVDEPHALCQHVIGQNRRVGQNHALDGGVRDVSLMPQRNVLHRRLDIRADDPRQTAHLFAGHRIALMGHCGGALLTLAERLFGFPNFGALQVPNFESDLLERCGQDRQRRDPCGVTVTGNHLRCNGRGLQVQPGADSFFRFRPDVPERAHGARNLADTEVFGRGREPRDIAPHLVVPKR